jgi:hypothetical protein
MTEDEVAQARAAGLDGGAGAGPGAGGDQGRPVAGRSAAEDAELSRRRRRVTVVVAAICLVAVVVVTVVSVLLVGPRRPHTYGDWMPLDRLWAQCDEGDAAACDELFVESPGRTDYERFGSTCGNRFPGASLACVQLMTPPPVDELGK